MVAAAIQALTKYLVFNAMASYPVSRHLTLQVNRIADVARSS